MKKSRSLGMLISYLYLVLNTVFSLFLSAFLLRRLGDVEYGLYQTISAFASYLVMLEFGTGTIMSRNVSMCRGKNDLGAIKKHTATIWYVNIFLSILIFFVAIVFYFNLETIYRRTMSAEQVVYGKKIFVLMIVYLLVSYFTQALDGFLLGMENYTFSKTVNLGRLLVRVLLICLCVFFVRKSIIIAIIDMLLSLFVFTLTFVYCKRKYKISLRMKDIDKRILKDALPLCVALMFQTFINQANNSVDKTIIGMRLSLEAVALYSVVQYCFSVICSITTLPISMYVPQVARDVEKGLKGRELASTLIAPCRLMCLIGGTILCGFFACGKQFIFIIYGSKYENAWLYALIIMFPVFFSQVNDIWVNVLDVLGKRGGRSCILLATTLMNIILTLIFISYWGILGAVIATAISTIIGQIILGNIYYFKVLKFSVLYLFKETLKGIFPCQLIAAAFGFVFGILIDNIYISFICSGGGFVLICAILLWVLGLNKQEKVRVKSILARRKK